MRAALKERLALGVLMQEKTTTVPDHQGLVPMGGGGCRPIRDGPAEVESTTVDVWPCTDSIHVLEGLWIPPAQRMHLVVILQPLGPRWALAPACPETSPTRFHHLGPRGALAPTHQRTPP
jgi:hypothetical protein